MKVLTPILVQCEYCSGGEITEAIREACMLALLEMRTVQFMHNGKTITIRPRQLLDWAFNENVKP